METVMSSMQNELKEKPDGHCMRVCVYVKCLYEVTPEHAAPRHWVRECANGG